MGSITIPSSFTQPHPVQISVNGFAGGISGLSPLFAIRDGLTTDSFIDFNDLTFKTAGWTTKQAAMTDQGDGHYVATADPFLWTVGAGKPEEPAYFVIEYDIPNFGIENDFLVVTAALPGEEFERTLDTVGLDTLGWQEVHTACKSPQRELRRLNLYDVSGRITGSAATFQSSGGIIIRRENLC